MKGVIAFTKDKSWRYTCGLIILISLVALVLIFAGNPHRVTAFDGNRRPAHAEAPTPETLFELVQMGRGDEALQLLRQLAYEIGTWGPAPNDEVVYDRFLPDNVRGAVLDFDELPIDCSDKQYSFDSDECLKAFSTIEQQVRFGYSLFAESTADGQTIPRPKTDDILATYIEEVGHSWQEYLYETDGCGIGQRLHITTLAESQRWAAGREYQIKIYILNLDGTFLQMSAQQHQHLLEQICIGYANPINAEIPPYPAPTGWPKPETWPTDNPPQDFLDNLCKPVIE